MEPIRLAMIGFGNVGQGFAQILSQRGRDLADQFGLPLQLVAVCDLGRGSLYDPGGLDPAALLETLRTTGRIDSLPAAATGWNAEWTIAASSADVVVELSTTNLQSGEPAFSYLRQAIEAGKHVVTTNKGPVALHYARLKSLADAHKVQIGVEGTVMSGTPALRLGSGLLAAAGIRRIQGIINGTTNYILTQMEGGAAYSAALAGAQAQGYAEADPTGDVEGYDAAAKAVILANLLMGASLSLAEVDRQGITALTPRDIGSARQASERWKLIAKVEKVDGKVSASVRPTRLPMAHPLASVSGATNAITYTTDLLGDVTLIGPGAGRLETGYALVCDLLGIYM